MEGVLAARLGDQIGSHSFGWGELIGDIVAGVAVGLVVGALAVGAVLATVATGGMAAVLIGAAVAGGVAAGASTSAGLMSWGQSSKSKKPSCSKVGGPCSPNVFVEKQKAARAMEDLGDHGHPQIKQGSATVFVNNKPFAREKDAVDCGGKLLEGGCAQYTYIGGSQVGAGNSGPDIDWWIGWTSSIAKWAGIAGLALAGGAIVGGAILAGGFTMAAAGVAGVGLLKLGGITAGFMLAATGIHEGVKATMGEGAAVVADIGLNVVTAGHGYAGAKGWVPHAWVPSIFKGSAPVPAEPVPARPAGPVVEPVARPNGEAPPVPRAAGPAAEPPIARPGPGPAAEPGGGALPHRPGQPQTPTRPGQRTAPPRPPAAAEQLPPRTKPPTQLKQGEVLADADPPIENRVRLDRSPTDEELAQASAAWGRKRPLNEAEAAELNEFFNFELRRGMRPAFQEGDAFPREVAVIKRAPTEPGGKWIWEVQTGTPKNTGELDLKPGDIWEAHTHPPTGNNASGADYGVLAGTPENRPQNSSRIVKVTENGDVDNAWRWGGNRSNLPNRNVRGRELSPEGRRNVGRMYYEGAAPKAPPPDPSTMAPGPERTAAQREWIDWNIRQSTRARLAREAMLEHPRVPSPVTTEAPAVPIAPTRGPAGGGAEPPPPVDPTAPCTTCKGAKKELSPLEEILARESPPAPEPAPEPQPPTPEQLAHAAEGKKLLAELLAKEAPPPAKPPPVKTDTRAPVPETRAAEPEVPLEELFARGREAPVYEGRGALDAVIRRSDGIDQMSSREGANRVYDASDDLWRGNNKVGSDDVRLQDEGLRQLEGTGREIKELNSLVAEAEKRKADGRLSPEREENLAATRERLKDLEQHAKESREDYGARARAADKEAEAAGKETDAAMAKLSKAIGVKESDDGLKTTIRNRKDSLWSEENPNVIAKQIDGVASPEIRAIERKVAAVEAAQKEATEAALKEVRLREEARTYRDAADALDPEKVGKPRPAPDDLLSGTVQERAERFSHDADRDRPLKKIGDANARTAAAKKEAATKLRTIELEAEHAGGKDSPVLARDARNRIEGPSDGDIDGKKILEELLAPPKPQPQKSGTPLLDELLAKPRRPEEPPEGTRGVGGGAEPDIAAQAQQCSTCNGAPPPVPPRPRIPEGVEPAVANGSVWGRPTVAQPKTSHADAIAKVRSVKAEDIKNAAKSGPFKVGQPVVVENTVKGYMYEMLTGSRPVDPIEVDIHGVVQDGHHRYLAGQLIGQPVPHEVVATRRSPTSTPLHVDSVSVGRKGTLLPADQRNSPPAAAVGPAAAVPTAGAAKRPGTMTFLGISDDAGKPLPGTYDDLVTALPLKPDTFNFFMHGHEGDQLGYAGHVTTLDWSSGLPAPVGKTWSAAEIAGAIRSNPSYVKGQDVYLWVCNAGVYPDGVGHQVSQLLPESRVFAAPDFIRLSAEERGVYSPDMSTWSVYPPPER